MKLKHIESSLSSVKREFPDPKIRLEQYPTSAELAASIVSFALREHDLGPGRIALDLGCGTGMLAMGCAIVECDAIVGIDCDPDALEVAIANAKMLNVQVEFLLAKVSDTGYIQKSTNPSDLSKVRTTNCGGKSKFASGRGRGSRKSLGSHHKQPTVALDPNVPDGLPLLDNCVDTVVTNPPFGTKHNAGMDIRFLKAGMRLARRAVYSFHKTSTREYLLKTIDESGFKGRVVAELKFDIPASYKFHDKANVDIAVDLIRVAIGTDENDSDSDNYEAADDEGLEEDSGYES